MNLHTLPEYWVFANCLSTLPPFSPPHPSLTHTYMFYYIHTSTHPHINTSTLKKQMKHQDWLPNLGKSFNNQVQICPPFTTEQLTRLFISWAGSPPSQPRPQPSHSKHLPLLGNSTRLVRKTPQLYKEPPSLFALPYSMDQNPQNKANV